MRPFNVVFIEEHTVRVHAESAADAELKALSWAMAFPKETDGWEFTRVEAEAHDGTVSEVVT